MLILSSLKKDGGFSVMDADELFFINGGSTVTTTTGTTTITRTVTVTDKSTGESKTTTHTTEKNYSYTTVTP